MTDNTPREIVKLLEKVLVMLPESGIDQSHQHRIHQLILRAITDVQELIKAPPR